MNLIKLERKFNALIVDDEQKICDMIQVFLNFTGIFDNIVSANDAIVAKQKLSNQKFDLFIIDNILPNKLGVDLIHHISNFSHYANSNKHKFILISGALKPEDVLSAAHYGIKEILVKPFSRKKLIKTVFKLLEIQNS